MAKKAKTTQAVADRKTGGRPSGPWAGKPWRDALRIAVKLPVDEDRKGKTKLDACVYALVAAGMRGDVPALKEIADRLDGKVPQALVGGDDDSPPIRFTEIRRTIVDPKS